jgi:NAD(P)-dependent dehydrogenase (short-subunit alcohol dehydrogenase family)
MVYGDMWVIGGDTGIGKAVVDYAINVDKYNSVRSYGKSNMDVADPYGMHDRIEFDLDKYGMPETIVYTAGVNALANIGELSYSDVHRQYSVNALGFIFLLDSLAANANRDLPLNIVAICSDAAETPMRGSIAYCSSKAALQMAIRCGAREMAPNWRINGISPSTVDGTPMTEYIDATVPEFRGWTPEQARSYEMGNMPMKRRATVDEVVRLVFDVINGPEFMTGSIIKLTGGK